MTQYKEGTTVFTSTIFDCSSGIKASFPKAVYEKLGRPKKVEYVIERTQIIVRVKK